MCTHIRVCVCVCVHMPADMYTKCLLYWHTGNIVCHTCLCHWIHKYLNNIYHYDYYDASIQLQENKYMPSKYYLFNQSINAVEINAHYTQLSAIKYAEFEENT